MKVFLFFLTCLMSVSAVAQDRSILLVTPKGVWKADVTNGVPGPFSPAPFDVIVQGFGGGGGTTPIPDPKPPTPDSPEVSRIAEISKTVLKDSSEATAVYTVVESIRNTAENDKEFTKILDDFAGLIDAQINAEGRFTTWVDKIVADAPDNGVKPYDVLAGLKKAFALDKSVTEMIVAESQQPKGTQVSEKAIDFVKLIEFIRMLIEIIRMWRGN